MDRLDYLEIFQKLWLLMSEEFEEFTNASTCQSTSEPSFFEIAFGLKIALTFALNTENFHWNPYTARLLNKY